MGKKSECTILELRRAGADIIARARIAGDRIVITNYGRPQAAIISLEDLAVLEAIKKPKT